MFFNKQGGSIVPGDHGNAALSGPNFQGASVTWSFEENNLDKIPVVYYTLNGQELENAYSAYEFALCEDLFITLPGVAGYTAAESVDNDGAAFSAGLSVGTTVYWAWPDRLYALDGEEYINPSSGKAVEYLNYSASLCEVDYAVDAGTLEKLNGTGEDEDLYNSGKPKAVAVAAAASAEYDFDVLNIDADGEFTIDMDGLCFDGQKLTVQPDGNYYIFVRTHRIAGVYDGYNAVTENEYWWLGGTEFCGKLAMSSVPDGFSLTLIKIPAVQAAKPTVSFSVIATISQ